MLLKPNYLRAAAITYAWVTAFGLLNLALSQKSQAHLGLDFFLGFSIIGGTFMALGVCVMFTPREVYFGADGFSIKTVFPSSGTHTWEELEAYSSWSGGTFLLKFQGKQSYQIVPSAFSKADWSAFIDFLRKHHPEKKTAFWFGPIPVRFGK